MLFRVLFRNQDGRVVSELEGHCSTEETIRTAQKMQEDLSHKEAEERPIPSLVPPLLTEDSSLTLLCLHFLV